jgi:hypothetical protein
VPARSRTQLGIGCRTLLSLLCLAPFSAFAGGAPLSAVGNLATSTGHLALDRTSNHAPHTLSLTLTNPLTATVEGVRGTPRLDSMRPGIRGEQVRLGEDPEPGSRTAFPIRWQNTPADVSPELVHIAKHFRHEGLPVVRLWQSGRNLLHVGLNGHGTPGIWFTQRAAD